MNAFDRCPTCELKPDQGHEDWCDLKLQRYAHHNEFSNDELAQTEVDLCEDCVMGVAGLLEGEPAEYELCREWWGWDFVSLENEHGEAEQHFSWSACDGCHSTLGGTRYPHEGVLISRPSQQSESEIHSASQPDTNRR